MKWILTNNKFQPWIKVLATHDNTFMVETYGAEPRLAFTDDARRKVKLVGLDFTETFSYNGMHETPDVLPSDCWFEGQPAMYSRKPACMEMWESVDGISVHITADNFEQYEHVIGTQRAWEFQEDKLRLAAFKKAHVALEQFFVDTIGHVPGTLRLDGQLLYVSSSEGELLVRESPNGGLIARACGEPGVEMFVGVKQFWRRIASTYWHPQGRRK